MLAPSNQSCSRCLPAAPHFSALVVFGDRVNGRGYMRPFTNGVFPAPPTYASVDSPTARSGSSISLKSCGMSYRIVNYAVVGALTKPAPDYPNGIVWSDTFPGQGHHRGKGSFHCLNGLVKFHGH